MLKDKIATTCAESGMEPHEAAALRLWAFAKFHMIAVHVWELALIPDLTLDSWLHHVFVIGVASIGSEPQALTGKPEIQPYLDSIGFFLIMGASLNSAVKACVVMYHLTAPNASKQANWMWASIAGAFLLTMTTYLALPCFFAFWHAQRLGALTLILCLLLLALLVFVEFRLILVKRLIAMKARSKARQLAAESSPTSGMPMQLASGATATSLADASPTIFHSSPMSRHTSPLSRQASPTLGPRGRSSTFLTLASFHSCDDVTDEDLKHFEHFG
eukprot:gnl/TRDRNA2_/TRDRNA2_165499_c0_seq2.p1 gnl/TRDRNA2_/TRDRNA2_165499_c0~~gnl/TRDRNA2_/TRDRNA2_165499_c0_seq2.p1  ORF type:complete len:274 (-),score=24.22 gnl/TRDRNA2_/TRDRNA2_165499_c0_seq2:56-877(-)